MSIKFLSTAVLESEDGLDFGKETAKDTLEVREQKRISSSGGKSLYDQLVEQKADKEDEYDQKGRLLRAPSAGLEEDDIELQAKSRAAQNEIENKDRRELTKFFEKKREIDKEQSKRVEDRGGEAKTKSLLTSKRKAGDSKKDQGKEPLPLLVGKKRRREEEVGEKTEEHESSTAVKDLLAGYGSDSD